MAEPLELKKTLNLPKTDFPMKASLPQNEPKQLVAWQDSNLYERILEARQGKPLFVLHDGPPYPTGEIHLGTGLKKNSAARTKSRLQNSAACAVSLRRGLLSSIKKTLSGWAFSAGGTIPT